MTFQLVVASQDCHLTPASYSLPFVGSSHMRSELAYVTDRHGKAMLRYLWD